MIPFFKRFINKLLASRFLQNTSRVIVLVALLMAFLYSYGLALRMCLWAVSFFALAFMLRHRAKRTSLSMIALVLGGLLLWPIDASMRFPVLRKLYAMTPFGPIMEVHPSPSGHCVAYFYDGGFVDPMKEVRFAHGLAFPEVRNSIPYDEKGVTDRRWDSNLFIVKVREMGVTFIYDESTRVITLPKGQ